MDLKLEKKKKNEIIEKIAVEYEKGWHMYDVETLIEQTKDLDVVPGLSKIKKDFVKLEVNPDKEKENLLKNKLIKILVNNDKQELSQLTLIELEYELIEQRMP